MNSALTPRSLACLMILCVRLRSELTYLASQTMYFTIRFQYQIVDIDVQLQKLCLTGNGSIHHFVKRA